MTVYALCGLIIVLSITLFKDIKRAKEIKVQIEAEKTKLAKIQAENDKLEAEIARAQSPEFVEKEVRDKLGLAREGEAVVVLPDKDILKKLAPLFPLETESLPDPTWKKWVNLFTSK